MARKTTPLTITEIKNARPGEKEYTLQDGGGLFLLVKPSGSKIWRFTYYRPADKKRTIISLGSLNDVSLSDARERRNEYRSLIAKGTDPQDYERRKREAESRKKGNTFEKVALDWYEMKKGQNLAYNTIKDIWRSLEKYVFPYIGNTPIDTLTARRFVEILTPIKARGNLETLKRVLQRINEVMDFAANSGLIDINTAANVRKAFPSPTKKHMPTIRPEQLPQLMHDLSVASIERQTRLLIEWQLLTVARPAEAAAARWEEIDLDAETWTIPAGRMKMRRDHVIPLCGQPKYTGEGTGIKKITGGDPVEINPKYEKRFTAVIRAVVLATNNNPMIFTERAGGVARRRVIFRFDNIVSEADKDRELPEKIAAEIPVIIRRLLANFSAPEKARALLIEQRDGDEALAIP